MDHDGTKAGFDNIFLKEINDAVHIPVIASGGAGSVQPGVRHGVTTCLMPLALTVRAGRKWCAYATSIATGVLSSAAVKQTRSSAPSTTGRLMPDRGATGVMTTAPEEGDSTGPPAA